MTNRWSDTGGSASDCVATTMARETVAAGCALSVTVYVHESRKEASGVPANRRVSGAKPMPEGSDPPAQVKA